MVLLACGRDIAQMMGLALPFEEMLVNNPGSWTLDMVAEAAMPVNFGLGEVRSFQTRTLLPALLTTRARPSVGSTKYDSPHQQAPTEKGPRKFFLVVEYPPRESSFIKNILPAFPAATAR